MSVPRVISKSKRFKRSWVWSGCGLLIFATAVSGLRASADLVTLEAIEVRGRSIEARFARLPVTVTAYSGDFMVANGITNYDDLARIVPGLFTLEQTVDNVSLNLRGLTSDTSDPRVQPRVSVFQDGIELMNVHGNGVALFDLAGVAVFKGPQATQFSRGVQSGALSLSSQRPMNANSGAVTLGVGEYHARSAEVVVNRVLVNDQLFARIALLARDDDGLVDNLADGSKLSSEGTFALRTSVRWQSTAATTADLIFTYQRDDTPNVAMKSARGVPGLWPEVDTDPDTAPHLNRGSELGVDRTIFGVTGIVAHPLSSAWTLTSTSGWRTVRSGAEFDADGSGHYLIETGEVYRGRQVSQELRFGYDGGGRLTGLLGASGFATRDRQDVTIRTDENLIWQFFTRTTPPVAFNPRYSEQNSNDTRFTSMDVFGRADYQLTDRLSVGGGWRLTEERIKARYESQPAPVRGNIVGLMPTSGGANNLFRNTNGWIANAHDTQSWAGEINGRYTLNPRHSIYGVISRGRHAPVLGFDEFTHAPRRGAEETVWNYEVGVKGSNATRRLRYEASAFQYHFEHFQTRRVSAPGLSEAFDGGRARGRGVEVALHGDVSRAFTMFATYGLTDAKFLETGEGGVTQLFAGHRFRLTSRHVGSLGGTATWEIAGRGAVTVTPLFTYRSEYFFEDNNAQNGGILRQGGHGLMSLRVGYRPRSGRWEVTGYVTNLLNKKYLLDAGNIGGAYEIPTSLYAAPRRVGVKLMRQF